MIDADGRCIVYKRRRPESSVFYRIVAEHSQTLLARVEALLAASEDDPPDVDEQTEALLAEQARTPLLLPPLSARLSATDGVRGPRCAAFAGYSLHANLAVEKRDRKTLERLLRYGLRPPFAQRRLSLTADGKVRLALRKPAFSGQRQLLPEPLDFLRRLLFTIPPRRMNMVRFHGVFAPRAKARPTLPALLPAVPPPRAAADGEQVEPVDQSTAQGDAEEPSQEPVPPCYRRPWHELLKRVFDLSVLICRVLQPQDAAHQPHRTAARHRQHPGPPEPPIGIACHRPGAGPAAAGA